VVPVASRFPFGEVNGTNLLEVRVVNAHTGIRQDTQFFQKKSAVWLTRRFRFSTKTKGFEFLFVK
jgi:hypothetical protein